MSSIRKPRASACSGGRMALPMRSGEACIPRPPSTFASLAPQRDSSSRVSEGFRPEGQVSRPCAPLALVPSAIPDPVRVCAGTEPHSQSAPPAVIGGRLAVEAAVVELVKELGTKYGTPMLFISHNLGLVLETCDRLCVMYSGEAVETGSGADTIDASASPVGVNVDSGAGADTITGSAGDDTFAAGAGDDTIISSTACSC
mgnify:CR=1 FL=1